MAVRLHEMTRTEQISVLREALRLLAEPRNWCQEEWKCEIGYRRTGEKTSEPEYAYCLEGAINQATVNLFGEMRARDLGAWDEELDIRIEDGRTPTQVISLNELVIEMYPTELESWLAQRAGTFGEDKTDFAAMFWQDQEGRTWEDVTGLIRQKLHQLGASA